ncbi:hypothetical protein C0J52_25974 [Blattella germanica]|nr:hypothetical protein C0J52_25974 [Blattella germanica]
MSTEPQTGEGSVTQDQQPVPSTNVNNNEEKWNKVVPRRNKRTVSVTGVNSECKVNESNLQGVPKMVSLHVCRLSPDTTTELLTSYLKFKFPEVVCEKLESRQPNILKLTSLKHILTWIWTKNYGRIVLASVVFYSHAKNRWIQELNCSRQ